MLDYKTITIAVVGASADPEKYGHKVFRDLLKSGYHAVAVNPKGEPILEQTVYKTLKDIPKLPELVITVVPPPVTEKIIDECHELGIMNLWMQPGSESDEAVRKAKSYGMTATSACFMTRNHLW